MFTAYSTYLDESNKKAYMDYLVDHIVKQASGRMLELYLRDLLLISKIVTLLIGSTLIPLEVFMKSDDKKKSSKGRAGVVLDSPLFISELRKELDEQKGINSKLNGDLERKSHELELAYMKMQGEPIELIDRIYL